MGYVDLHLHTTASDGVMSPSEIVRYAKAKACSGLTLSGAFLLHLQTRGLNRAGTGQGLAPSNGSMVIEYMRNRVLCQESSKKTAQFSASKERSGYLPKPNFLAIALTVSYSSVINFFISAGDL